MRTTLRIIALLSCIVTALPSNAQIGYQVSLLNTATGEPRANVTVNAAVTITDSKGGIIYSGSQSATSNDFGVLSLTVGNANTFQNADFSKLPFFIQVSVDGKMIGKSQILNVPVAEAAKKVVPAIPEEALSRQYTFIWYRESGSWGEDSFIEKITLHKNNIFLFQRYNDGVLDETHEGTFDVEGNTIYLYPNNNRYLLIMKYHNGKMYFVHESSDMDSFILSNNN